MENQPDMIVRANRSSRRPALRLLATLSGALVAAAWLIPTLAAAAPAPFVDSGSGAANARTVGRVTGVFSSVTNVRSFRWGATLAVSSTGVPSGKPAFADVSFTKVIDQQSPQLLVSLVQGTHLPNVTLEVFQPGSSTVQVKYELSDVLVVGATHADPGRNNGGQPLEEVSLTFTKIQVTSGNVVFCYDIARAARC